MPTRPAPKPTPTPKPPTAPVKPVATRPAPAPVKPPASPAPAPSRPAPAQRNAPSVSPAPVVKPPVVKQPTSKPTTTQPSTRSGQQPQKPKPTQPPGMNVDPAKLPAKPTAGQRVQGKSGVWWEYDAKKNSWGKAKTQAPTSGAAPSTPSGETPQVDTTVVEETQYDIPKTKEEIEKEAESEVSVTDPSRRASFTDLMGSLGFGLGAQGGQGYATFEDVFKGAGGDSSKFILRDAMGREITPDSYEAILGSDVYSEQGAKNIAGTALGNLISQARQSAAQEAESRSSSGIGSDTGVAAAQGSARKSTGQEAFNELISKLRGGVTEIQSGRGQALLDAMKSIGANPSGVVKTVSPASRSAQTTSGSSSNLPKLTPGAGGTFRTTTDKIIKGSGTKKSKTDALRGLLKSHSLTPLQSSTINQMIKNLR